MNYSIFDVDGTILDSMEVWNTLASRYIRSLKKEPEENLDEIVSEMSLEQSATYLKNYLLIYNRVVVKMKVVYPFYESVIIKKPKKVNV